MHGYLGGMHGCSRGASMVAPGGCAWFFWAGMRGFFRGGHVWFFLGVHGFSGRACMVFSRGVCVVFSGGVCVVFSWGDGWFFLGGGMHRIRRDTVNEQAVCILLECILV